MPTEAQIQFSIKTAHSCYPAKRRQTIELALYRLFTSITSPATGLLLSYRERCSKEDPQRRSERFGIASIARPIGPLVWFHAASVGEVISIVPLIGAIGKIRPDHRFLLTTGTISSARVVAGRLPPKTVHQFLPLDAAQFVQTFLNYWQPVLGVFVEQEIWPNIIVESNRRKIPLAIVNARMSKKSFSRWRKHARLAESLFDCFEAILAQNEQFADRFRRLGAPNALSIGNLKLDAPPPPVDLETLSKLKSALGARVTLLAASTHAGEELEIARAHELLARRFPGFCTVIVPRHPERGKRIADVLSSNGLSVALRSWGQLPNLNTDIYIADTIGELGTFYSAMPIAFVGGSLIPHGGQNPIEAVRHSACVLTGPSWFNFDDAYRALLHNNGAKVVLDATELAAAVIELYSIEGELDRSLENAQGALRGLEGSLEGAMRALLPIIDRSGSGAEVRRSGAYCCATG